MENLKSISSRELLTELIGAEATKKLYKGSLAKLLQRGSAEPELRPIYSAREIWERLYQTELAAREVFHSPQTVKDYLAMVYATKRHEVFVVLFLDVQNRLIACEEMFRGTLTQTSVYPREVVVQALEHGAAGVVLSHNHPSGSAQPSRSDEALTQTLKAALSLIDVRVLDHIVFGGGETVSLAERGLI